jgi:hypothetical protein
VFDYPGIVDEILAMAFVGKPLGPIGAIEEAALEQLDGDDGKNELENGGKEKMNQI